MREIERTPLPENVSALLDDAAERHRDRPFLVFFDDGDTLTYADAARHVRDLAGALAALGVGAGTHVAVMLLTTRHWPVTWLALARLGAVTVPINYNYTPRELAWMLEDSKASHLVIHRDYVGVLESIEGGAPLARGNVVVAGGATAYPHHLERMMDARHRAPAVEIDRDALSSGLLDACFQRFSTETLNDRAHRICIDTFKPFDDDAPEALRKAMFEFQRMAVRVTNGRIRVTRERHADGGEAWTVEDAGRWLW